MNRPGIMRQSPPRTLALRRCVGGSILLGGFVCRCVPFEVGAARRRAVRQCQVNWVALFGGSGSPSNTRSRGPALRWKLGAAGAGRQCAPAALAGRTWAAPQLHR